ncbi:hypothetical protein M069_4616 [Bacteroides fragilis str. B1 (UDC16-1)]|nr:hypothetical protein M069_4616 [Bacteroides fragilis str. B1 (UDC16-1)]
MPDTANVQNFRMKPAGELLKLLSIFCFYLKILPQLKILISEFSLLP